MTVDYARSSAPVSREATWYSAPAPRAQALRRRASDRGLGQNLSGTLESGCIAVIWSVAEGSTSGVWLQVCRPAGQRSGPALGAPGAHCDVRGRNGQGMLFALGARRRLHAPRFRLAVAAVAPASEQLDGLAIDGMQALPMERRCELRLRALLDPGLGIGRCLGTHAANGLEAWPPLFSRGSQQSKRRSASHDQRVNPAS